VLAGLLEINSGEIRIDGRDVTDFDRATAGWRWSSSPMPSTRPKPL